MSDTESWDTGGVGILGAGTWDPKQRIFYTISEGDQMLISCVLDSSSSCINVSMAYSLNCDSTETRERRYWLNSLGSVVF